VLSVESEKVERRKAEHFIIKFLLKINLLYSEIKYLIKRKKAVRITEVLP
jgi:hypothetical protein